MKLCRFELKSLPGEARSGIVYGAKIYETDGANPIATYEADMVRPLSPIGTPPSIRFFDFDGLAVDTIIGEDRPSPLYVYGNPRAVIGPSTIVQAPLHIGELDFKTYLGVVIAQPGANVPIELADDLVLGFTLCTVLIGRDVENQERKGGIGPGRSRDFAIAVGPVLTTPDELEEVVCDDARGRRYELSATVKVNGVEVRSGALTELRHSHAECIVSASESVPLSAGELFALGPVAPRLDNQPFLEPGDEMLFAIERLGSLSLKIQ